MRPPNQYGFTLIDLMIVVAIIGILSTFAIPAYQDYARRSYVAEGLNIVAGVETSIWDYYSAQGKFPTDNASAGVAEPVQFATKTINRVDVAGDTIIITYTSLVENAPNNTLTLVATFEGGSLSWNCSGGFLPAKYRPTSCR